MKIATFGTKNFYTAQLPRIEAGFKLLNHEIVENESDLIYSNDSGGYQQAIEHKDKFGSKLIFNVLDIPEHIPEFKDWLIKAKDILVKTDYLTSISKFTQSKLKEYLGFDSKVIYQPIKPVYYKEVEKDIDFLMTGRVLDSNKRCFIARQILEDDPTKIFATCGSEYPGFGRNHFGIVDDEELNNLYNRSKIVFAFGKIEGIALQIPESIVCRTPVIALTDCEAALEFCPPEFLCDPNLDSIKNKISQILNNYSSYQEICDKYVEKYKIMFSGEEVARKILELC